MIYEVTITGSLTAITYRCVGPVSAAKESARIKAMQKALTLGDDIRIRLTPIDVFVAG